MSETKKTDAKRMVAKKRHPLFKRPNYGRPDRKRIGEAWRRPRGTDNKQREKFKSAGALPGIGWRTPRAIRGLHPSGFEDFLVCNASQLASLDAEKHAVRISSTVGKRKRQQIVEEAKKKGLRLLNE